MKKAFGALLAIVAVVLLQPVNDCAAIEFSAAGLRLQKKVQPLRDMKRRNVVTQSLDISCGPASLSTLFKYYFGDPVSEAEIVGYLLRTVSIEQVRQRRGFSLFDLKRFAESKGYKATGYRMADDFFLNLNKPCLVPIMFKNFKHFVIVRGVVRDTVFISDPTAGNTSMKFKKFKRMWIDSIGLVVEAKDKAASSSTGALVLSERDFVFADRNIVRRVIDHGQIRTAIFPGEF